MEPPPIYGNPYQYLTPGTQQPGQTGVRWAWTVLTTFWGYVVNHAWADLDNIAKRR